MRNDVIIIAVVLVIAVIFVAVAIGFMYPNGWGRPPMTGPYSGNGVSTGMGGPGMMGSGMMGSGMMGGMGMMSIYTADSRPLSEADARNRALAFVNQYYSGAKIGDFMEFSLNYYVELQDSSNMSIAEILVDRYTGIVTPEPGPNMMWNTRYQTGTGTTATYDLAGTRSQAERFLTGYLPGATIQESITYPGYYTFDFGRGEIEGMLSVNAYTGYIWVHTWHGYYIGG